MKRFERIGRTLMNRTRGSADFHADPIASILHDHFKSAVAAQILGQAYVIAVNLVKNNKDAAISFVEARNLNPTQPVWVERINSGIEKIKEIEIAKGGTVTRHADDLDPSMFKQQHPVPVQTGDDRH